MMLTRINDLGLGWSVGLVLGASGVIAWSPHAPSYHPVDLVNAYVCGATDELMADNDMPADKPDPCADYRSLARSRGFTHTDILDVSTKGK